MENEKEKCSRSSEQWKHSWRSIEAATRDRGDDIEFSWCRNCNRVVLVLSRDERGDWGYRTRDEKEIVLYPGD